MSEVWRPSRAAGLERLQNFLPKAGKEYKSKRNYDSLQHVSGLSPYLTHRLVLDGEVVSTVLESHKPAEAESFLDEVLWRTYWKGWLEGRPQVFSNWERLLAEDSRRWPEREDYQGAIAGKTGIEPFDHWVEQLKSTGYLHNHARMWFASIWIFTLKLPWSLGSAFFLEHLLDGDVASNLLSWRWVAGLHTKGKHYLARADNIKKYTEGRFHPSGKLSEEAPPLNGFPNPPYKSPISFPFSASSQIGESYALLLTADDLCPELGPIGEMKPSLVLSLDPAEAYAENAISNKVLAFKKDAMEDAATRAAEHFGVESRSFVLGADAPAALKGVMEERQVTSLVYFEPFIGPWKKMTSALSSRDVGVTFFPLRRPWDGLLHPHAVKGYFHFKKHAFTQVVRTRGSFHAPR